MRASRFWDARIRTTMAMNIAVAKNETMPIGDAEDISATAMNAPPIRYT